MRISRLLCQREVAFVRGSNPSDFLDLHWTGAWVQGREGKGRQDGNFDDTFVLAIPIDH